MIFLHHALQPLLALIAVPILIHLLAHCQPPVYRFGSNMFIQRVVKESVQLKKPKEWWLLLLRTLLFAAMVLLFLRPLYFPEKSLASLAGTRNVVIIVDASASMAYIDEVQTRFAAACAEASGILGKLAAHDRANIIWLKAYPEKIYPRLGSNLTFLQAQLKRARVTSERGDYTKAIALAVEMLQGQPGTNEIFVIADFQKSSWFPSQYSIPPGIQLIQVPIGHEIAANGAITDLRFFPPRPLVGEDLTISCEVANFSPVIKHVTLFLSGPEVRLSHDLSLPPWRREEVVFACKADKTGMAIFEAALSEDAFPDDNHRHLLVPVEKSLRVGICLHNPESAKIIQHTLQALAWTEPILLKPQELNDLSDLAALFLTWDGQEHVAVKEFLNSGGTVIWDPSPSTKLHDIATFFGGKGAFGEQQCLWQSVGKAYSLRIVAEKAAIFQFFAHGDNEAPTAGIFSARFAIPRDLFPAQALLICYTDDVPALACSSWPGKLYFWNLPLAEKFSDWSRQIGFLPLVGELLLHSRVLPKNSVSQEHEPGERTNYLLSSASGEVELRDGKNHKLATTTKLAPGGEYFWSAPLEKCGVYRWSAAGKGLAYAMVNFPAIESDLRTWDRQELNKTGIPVMDSAIQVTDLHSGIELWPYLLLAALVLIATIRGLEYCGS